MREPSPLRAVFSSACALLLLSACGDDAGPVGSGTDPTTGSDTTGPDAGSSTGSMTSTGTATSTDAESSTGGLDDTTGEPELCGNGSIDPGETCDDGINDGFSPCSSTCTLLVEPLWTVSYDGPAGHIDVFTDVLVASDGSIYAVGRHRTSEHGNDLVVKQYTVDGREGWTYTYDGEGGAHDTATAAAWHPDGDLVVVGSTETTAQGEDILVIRVDHQTHEAAWVDVYDGPGEGEGVLDQDDYGRGVAVDDAGDIVIVGTQRSAAGNFDILVRKLDGSGDELWSRVYDGAYGGNDFGLGAAIDADGDILVLGNMAVAPQQSQGWLGRIAGNGDEIELQSLEWRPSAVAIDGDGNWALAGWGGSGFDGIFIRVAKYDSALTLEWEVDHSPGPGFHSAGAVAFDAAGDLYVAGAITVIEQQDDIWAAKIDRDGSPQWSVSYDNEVLSLADYGNGIAVDSEGNVLVVGSETVLGQQHNGWLTKYAQH